MNTTIDTQTQTLIDGTDRFVTSTVGMQINNDTELEDAAGLLVLVKERAKKLTAKKKGILDPLTKAAKEIRDLFKNPEELLKTAESNLKDAMLDYHQRKDAAAQKKMDQITGRLDRGTMKVETGIAKLSEIDQAETNVGGVSFKQGPEKVRILNVAALVAARPELLQRERVLEALRMELSADVKAGAPVPAGAEAYREKVAAVRA